MNKPELLAPAGNLEKMKTAVQYGADAVYFGGPQLGLRAGAGNFTKEEILEGVAFCHANDVRAYVTVNIIPHEQHFEGMEDYLKFLVTAGVDAMIISDPGILMIARQVAPDMEIHLSTQANATSFQSAHFWHQQGIQRIVPARELTLDEIKAMTLNPQKKFEVETFVHGAMCISYSGRCLLSSYMTGRNANLGDCAQPCRWKYYLVEEQRPNEYFPIVEDDDGTFIFNSKDLCMIQNLKDLVDAGIDSFKIEGRMKSAYYIATVLRSYRNALDELIDGKPFDAYWYDEIKKASHRDFTTGFYYGNPREEGQLYTSSSYIRGYDFIGLVLDYDQEAQIATIEQRNKFSVGDQIEIFGPYGRHIDFTIQSLTNHKGETVTSAHHPQEIIKMKINHPIKPNYMLRKAREDV